jgi:pimeloyl-ACP methyl ester carboxylesterase
VPDQLEPSLAVQLADDIYTINDAATQGLFLQVYKEQFDTKKAQTASSQTGVFILKIKEARAVFATGVGTFKGQAFAIFRGTEAGYDWLTDMNTGVTLAHHGVPVHQGFYYVFRELLQEFKRFVDGLNEVSVVHCVGHSLGGALATLAADWLRARSTLAVNVYTFGSPRVGIPPFARKFTDRIGAANVYRVHHDTDPVAMVPTWPFFHVPDPGIDYMLPSPMAVLVYENHYMESYKSSVGTGKSWHQLHKARPKDYGQVAVQKWLKSDGVISLSANTLALMDAALRFVFQKALHVTGISLELVFASSFTLMDRMAMVLAKLNDLRVEASEWVRHLMKKMGALAGIVVGAAVQLSVDFIRAVFIRLQHQIIEMIRKIARSVG